ncbi:MAG: HD-GYP domain-containing protein [Vicinamibacterales bacterium]|jgi:HD-GYP domain-containing protein (c-di-GMP phosphodiesterase class II)
MRLVRIEELRAGDRLGRDIFARPEALPLLRAGIRVSDGYKRSLVRSGITAVWIDDGLSAGIEPIEMVAEATKQKARGAIADALREASETLATGGTLSRDTVRDMRGVAELIVGDVEQNVHSALALSDLANADSYTLKHSLAVTTLGLVLGSRVMRKYGWTDGDGHRRFDGIEDRLLELGVGLLLHDIGKLAVPPEILRKPGPLTGEEWTAMRAHPTLGFEILSKADGISLLSRAVVRSHHERWLGNGYPDGLAGTAIHLFARIAAVADVFDALTSDRHYRKAMPLREAYDFVVDRADRDFDREVVSVFQSSVAPYPPGTPVRLSDGRGGLVQEVQLGDVISPIIRVVVNAAGELIPPQVVDLSTAVDLTIVSTEVEIPAEVPLPH